MDNSVKKVILLFKTHLDVGFTDYSKNVIDNYVSSYIPKAISLAKELKKSGKSERFVWTVGSWLIEHYLEVSDKIACGEMERAILDSDISYHALPFTMHTESMSEGLFNYGLSIAKKLDARFGKNTVAGKYTDVPGHTKAMIPHLAKAGIKFVHIGVNPASTPPNVPDVFRWQFDNDEIVVMYNKGYYGEASRLPSSDTIVWFAHTNDNCGPQSMEDILDIYDKVRECYPSAQIVASDLNAVYNEIEKNIDSLPVVTSEIGDTWIHGVGTDPRKVSGYRTILRLADGFSKHDREECYKHLLCVPEHTWGMNEQIYLRDYNNYYKCELRRMMETYKYKKFMSSWDEQRKYVTDSCEKLSVDARKSAVAALNDYKKPLPDLTTYTPVSNEENIMIDNYKIHIRKDGSINFLSYMDKVIFDSDDSIGKFSYEVFGSENYARFQKQYLTYRFDWAVDDFGKNGCEKVLTSKKSYTTSLLGIYRKENELLLELKPPFEACESFSCPRKIYVTITFNTKKISFDLAWYGKDANRLAEAMWLTFKTDFTKCQIRKLGKWIDTRDVISNGGRTLHATDYGVMLDDKIEIETLDTALIAPGKPSLLNFSNKLPDFTHGVSFNLYNNVWGTNFPMWYNEDARCRFILRF